MKSFAAQRNLSVPARKRLRALYVVATASLAALIPLILFAGFWIRAELNRGQRDVEFYLSARAGTLSQRIDAEVQQQVKALQALSVLPDLDEGSTSFAGAVSRVRGEMSHWSSLSLVELPSGRPLITTAGEDELRPRPERLASAAADPRPVVSSRLEGGSVVLFIGVPVIRNGQAGRALVIRFDPKDFEDIVADQARTSTLAYSLVDGSGLVIASTPGSGTPAGTQAPESLANLLGGGNASGEHLSPDGEPAWSASVRSGLTSWTSVATVSGRQAERLSSRSTKPTIAAGALSLLLAGILAVFIIYNVMQRRVSEERVAASRALGELDQRLLAATRDALEEQKKAASEREVLLREIYHRVKNNLQIVQSLLRLGSRDLKPEQREPFESAVRRIGAMARVHTLLYNSPDLASIDFRDYLEELLRELSEGFAAEERSIVAALDAHSMRMPLDTAVPLAFIAVEILTNSFKHAFPEGRAGRITVEVRRDTEDAILTIRDDGIGMSPDAAGKRRLGLTIVRKLVAQIGGTLEEPQTGSATFVVRFPLEQNGQPARVPPLRDIAAPAAS